MAGAAAKRYARAVFELAQEEGQVEEWGRRLEAVRDLLALPELREVLANPSISVERRQEVVGAALGPEAGAEGVNLAKLLIASGRVDAAEGVLEQYGLLADAAAGRVQARATTAVELSQAERAGLARDLSQRFGREVRLETSVDPAILGGLVVQVGDRVIDGSLATRLRQLRRRLAGI